MEVILLERVGRLGQMGDVVRVKDGFARNFPAAEGQGAARHQGKPVALRNHEGRARGAQSRTARRGREGRQRSSTARASRCCARRRKAASSTARSRPRDIAMLVIDKGFKIDRNQITLNTPIKTIGMHKVPIALHPEVEVIDHGCGRPQRRRSRAPGARRGHHGRAHRGAGGAGRGARQRREASSIRKRPEALRATEETEAARRRRQVGVRYSSNGSSLGTVAASTRVSGGASAEGSDFAELGPLALSRGRLRLGALLRALRRPFGLLLRLRCCCALAFSFSCGAPWPCPCQRAGRQGRRPGSRPWPRPPGRPACSAGAGSSRSRPA